MAAAAAAASQPPKPPAAQERVDALRARVAEETAALRDLVVKLRRVADARRRNDALEHAVEVVLRPPPRPHARPPPSTWQGRDGDEVTKAIAAVEGGADPAFVAALRAGLTELRRAGGVLPSLSSSSSSASSMATPASAVQRYGVGSAAARPTTRVAAPAVDWEALWSPLDEAAASSSSSALSSSSASSSAPFLQSLRDRAAREHAALRRELRAALARRALDEEEAAVADEAARGSTWSAAQRARVERRATWRRAKRANRADERSLGWTAEAVAEQRALDDLEVTAQRMAATEREVVAQTEQLERRMASAKATLRESLCTLQKRLQSLAALLPRDDVATGRETTLWADAELLGAEIAAALET